jgi:hypothetical protein
MSAPSVSTPHTHSRRRKLQVACLAFVGATAFALGGVASAAGPTPVGLGNATDAAVVSAASPTNDGTSFIEGDVSSTNPSQPGFVPCIIPGNPADCVVYVPPSVQNPNDSEAIADQADALAAWVATSSLSGATVILPGLGGTTRVAGLYNTGGAVADITGTFTLDAANDADSVWIFQTANLQSAISGNVMFVNIPAGTTAEQLACNVFWTTDSADLLGATFVGTIMANTSITVGNAVTVDGRLFTNTGNVTLIGDTITRPTCLVLPAGTGGVLPVPSATPGATPGATPSGPTGSGTGIARFTG